MFYPVKREIGLSLRWVFYWPDGQKGGGKWLEKA